MEQREEASVEFESDDDSFEPSDRDDLLTMLADAAVEEDTDVSFVGEEKNEQITLQKSLIEEHVEECPSPHKKRDEGSEGKVIALAPVIAEAINFGEKEGRPIIISGTLNKLVEHVAYEGDMQDKDFLHHFLITHRYFTDSVTFLDLLMELRFHLQAPPGGGGPDFDAKAQIIRMRTVNVLKKWLDTCSTDFDDKLTSRLNYHLDIIKSANDKWAEVLRNQLERHQQGGGATFSVSGETPKPQVPKSLKTGEISIMDIPAIETARQLTLIESYMFRQIPKDEYLNKEFNNPDLAPYMNSLIKRFNDVTSWIASEILNRETPKERAAVLVRFLEIAQHFREMNNFNGVMEVFSSLSITPISRLKQTWKILSDKQKKVYDEFENLMDPKGNYKIYRGLLKTLASKLPLLPFQGVYLQDLTFIEENADMLGNGLVNFEKMHMLGRLLTEVMHFQSVAYNLEAVPIIRDWLFSRPFSYTEDELYKRSRELEPPPAPIPATPGQVPEPPAAPKRHGFLNRMRSLSMKDLKQEKINQDAKIPLSSLVPVPSIATNTTPSIEDKSPEASPRLRRSSASERLKGFKVNSAEKKEEGKELSGSGGSSPSTPITPIQEVTVVNPLFRRQHQKSSPPLRIQAEELDMSPRSRSNSTSADLANSSSKHPQTVIASHSRTRSFTSPNPKLKDSPATKKKIGKSSKIVMK